MTVDEIALMVVYVVRSPDDEMLLRLHLDRIARHTAVPYRIHAATPRITERGTEMLRADPHVELCPTSPSTDLGSREHAHHLDQLLERVRAGDASHVATLDLDSFPVADRWHDTLALAAPSGIAAILRTENLDTVLPHPSCTWLPRRFVDEHPFSFSPDSDGTAAFRRFLHSTGQRADTGIRLARILSEERIAWHRMRRSNRTDLHPLIAGIYDDVVFHLGAGGRESLFRRDLARSPIHRLTRPLERIPVPRRLGAARRRTLDRIRRPTERRLVAVNQAAASRSREWLREDPDALFTTLRDGEEPTPSG